METTEQIEDSLELVLKIVSLYELIAGTINLRQDVRRLISTFTLLPAFPSPFDLTSCSNIVIIYLIHLRSFSNCLLLWERTNLLRDYCIIRSWSWLAVTSDSSSVSLSFCGTNFQVDGSTSCSKCKLSEHIECKLPVTSNFVILMYLIEVIIMHY